MDPDSKNAPVDGRGIRVRRTYLIGVDGLRSPDFLVIHLDVNVVGARDVLGGIALERLELQRGHDSPFVFCCANRSMIDGIHDPAIERKDEPIFSLFRAGFFYRCGQAIVLARRVAPASAGQRRE